MNQIQAAALSILGKKKKRQNIWIYDIHCKPAYFIPTQ